MSEEEKKAPQFGAYEEDFVALRRLTMAEKEAERQKEREKILQTPLSEIVKEKRLILLMEEKVAIETELGASGLSEQARERLEEQRSEANRKLGIFDKAYLERIAQGASLKYLRENGYSIESEELEKAKNEAEKELNRISGKRLNPTAMQRHKSLALRVYHIKNALDHEAQTQTQKAD